jgi:hypothetical protein
MQVAADSDADEHQRALIQAFNCAKVKFESPGFGDTDEQPKLHLVRSLGGWLLLALVSSSTAQRKGVRNEVKEYTNAKHEGGRDRSKPASRPG